jgi:hypothetical protein
MKWKRIADLQERILFDLLKGRKSEVDFSNVAPLEWSRRVELLGAKLRIEC